MVAREELAVFFICPRLKMVSFRGQKDLGPLPDWSPLGV